MAWAIAGRIVQASQEIITRARVSPLVISPADSKIHFSYTRRANKGINPTPTDASTAQPFHRTYDGSTMSSEISVATLTGGYHGVCLASFNNGSELITIVEKGEYTTGARLGAIRKSTNNGATWSAYTLGNGNPWLTTSLGNTYLWAGLYSNGSDEVGAITVGEIGSGARYLNLTKRTANPQGTQNPWYLSPIREAVYDGNGQLPELWGLENTPAQCCIISGTTFCVVFWYSLGQGFKRLACVNGSVNSTVTGQLTTILDTTVEYARVPNLCIGTDGVLRMAVHNLKTDGVTPTIDLFSSNDMGRNWTSIARPLAFSTTDSHGTAVGWPKPVGFDRGDVGLCLDSKNQWWLTSMHYATDGSIDPLIVNRLHTFKGSADGLTWTLLSSENLTDGAGIAPDISQVESGPHSSVVMGSDLYRVVPARASATGYVETWLMKNAGVAVTSRASSGGSSTGYRYSEG